jgi:hypothetical protein
MAVGRLHRQALVSVFSDKELKAVERPVYRGQYVIAADSWTVEWLTWLCLIFAHMSVCLAQ